MWANLLTIGSRSWFLNYGALKQRNSFHIPAYEYSPAQKQSVNPLLSFLPRRRIREIPVSFYQDNLAPDFQTVDSHSSISFLASSFFNSKPFMVLCVVTDYVTIFNSLLHNSSLTFKYFPTTKSTLYLMLSILQGHFY